MCGATNTEDSTFCPFSALSLDCTPFIRRSTPYIAPRHLVASTPRQRPHRSPCILQHSPFQKPHWCMIIHKASRREQNHRPSPPSSRAEPNKPIASPHVPFPAKMSLQLPEMPPNKPGLMPPPLSRHALADPRQPPDSHENAVAHILPVLPSVFHSVVGFSPPFTSYPFAPALSFRAG